MNNHPFLGETSPDFVSDLLKSGFFRFESDFDIDGLAKESDQGKTLMLLAVVSNHKKKGNFRSFILEAKKHYSQIMLMEVWNVELAKALVRYGFEFKKIWHGGTDVDCFVWNKDTYSNSLDKT